jgi:ATP-dependent helicase/nuclease subunit A
VRELPIYFACEPRLFDRSLQEAQPADRVMLRGRLDAAIETDEGLVLVDYKTDRITADEVPSRSAGYERQLGFYRDALLRIGRKKIAGAYLAFLTPRILQKV